MNKKLIIVVLLMMVMSGCAKTGLKTSASQDSGVAGFSLRQDELNMPQERIYFPFATDHIVPDAAQAVDKNIEWLRSNDNAYVILEGHCDEVGDREFNTELGDRRARAVKAYMIAKNVPAERIIMVVSFGEDRPLNPGHRIEDLRENRRVEFVIR